MSDQEIGAILRDWDRHVENFKALNIEADIKTTHCGTITLVPQLSTNPPPGRNELLIDDFRELLLIRHVFGPGVEIVEYKNKSAVLEEEGRTPPFAGNGK